MKTAILYYSFGGLTRKWVQSFKTDEDVFEIKEVKKRGIFGAYLVGCPQAMKRKSIGIKPINADLDQYDKIVLVAPVWAAHPAPAFNDMLKLVPKGKTVKLILTSASGSSEKSKDGTIGIAKDMGLDVEEYIDIKTTAKS